MQRTLLLGVCDEVSPNHVCSQVGNLVVAYSVNHQFALFERCNEPRLDRARFLQGIKQLLCLPPPDARSLRAAVREPQTGLIRLT